MTGELRRRGWGVAHGGRVRDSTGQQVAETIADRHLHDMQGPAEATRVQDLPQLCNSSEEGCRWSCTGGSGARGGSSGTCCGSVSGSRVWGGGRKTSVAAWWRTPRFRQQLRTTGLQRRAAAGAATRPIMVNGGVNSKVPATRKSRHRSRGPRNRCSAHGRI